MRQAHAWGGLVIRVEAGGKWLAFPCQGGDRVCRIPLAPQRGAQGQTWALMSGDGDPVTVHPSIDCQTCGFHGWIRDGRFETITPGDPNAVQRQIFEGEE